jgi:hypothetical protein
MVITIIVNTKRGSLFLLATRGNILVTKLVPPTAPEICNTMDRDLLSILRNM